MSRVLTVIVEGHEYVVEVENLEETPIKARVNHKTYLVKLAGDQTEITKESEPTEATDHKPELPLSRQQENGTSSIAAPMPGNIIEVMVKPGDLVKPGDVICVLEAMKMKNLIHTSRSGVIATVNIEAGQTVDFGKILTTFET
jgi:biotin carboxyl carrier protein